MKKKKNATVSFRTKKFNTTEPKEYFLNPICYGDDVGKWLLSEFRTRNILHEEDGPDQEDFGWYVNFSLNKRNYTILIIYSEEEQRWILVLEHNAGMLGSLFGKRNQLVDSNSINLIDEILRAAPEINDVQWENI